MFIVSVKKNNFLFSDFQKNKKSFDIVFSQEVLQQMARDLVNTFINKIPGGVKNFNFTQYAEEVEKIIKTYLPYGILSVANGEISNFVQNVLPQLVRITIFSPIYFKFIFIKKKKSKKKIITKINIDKKIILINLNYRTVNHYKIL